jgi:hypothetical protein
LVVYGFYGHTLTLRYVRDLEFGNNTFFETLPEDVNLLG